jgi:XTP/dITP diphosphohydrolase
VKELLVATGNQGKFREIEALLRDSVESLWSLADFPEVSPAEEDGASFAENAVKKAMSAARATGKPTIADDSGLEVDALGGRPGVYSARFAGVDAGDAENNLKLLEELTAIPDGERTAAFRCVIALCYPDCDCRTFSGELTGTILHVAKGTGGFGYDPLFLVTECSQTLAELPMALKNTISHRGRALAKLKEYLRMA